MFSFSQNYTEEQNTQWYTETLSQPITQNLTAIFGSNALCSLYAGGLLWAQNVRQKGSVNSVRSVRDKTPHCEYPTIFLSQKITEKNRVSKPVGVTSHFTPLPAGEGKGEGPAGDRRGASWSQVYTHLFNRTHVPFGRL